MTNRERARVERVWRSLGIQPGRYVVQWEPTKDFDGKEPMAKVLTSAQRKKESTSIQNEARKTDIAKLRGAVVPVKHLLKSAGKHELQLMQLTERVRVIEGVLRSEFGDNAKRPKKRR